MTPLAAWKECLRAEGLSEDPPHRGRNLLARWDEPHRHYHTSVHLQSCIERWERLRDQLQAPSLVGLTLLYHDAIYDPQARDNEAASAGLARIDLVGLGMADRRIAEVEHLIHATDHRQKSAHPDAAAVIDIDLAILGAEAQAYRRYVHGWRTGRAQVLGHFLERSRLFTSGLLDELEDPARRNMRHELDGLNV